MLKNVVSLFDGISCLQIALNRLGIPYENYYASEIDKPCITITQKNYPSTIRPIAVLLTSTEDTILTGKNIQSL